LNNIVSAEKQQFMIMLDIKLEDNFDDPASMWTSSPSNT